MKQFEPGETLRAIQDYQLTDIEIVPTHLAVMLDFPDFGKYDLSSLKRILYASAPMPRELLRKGLKIWGPIFVQGFGQTESGPQIAWMHGHDHDVLDKTSQVQAKLSSCGQPAFGCHVRIVDEKGTDVPPGEVGEIIVKSRHTMIEYWHKPEETAETPVFLRRMFSSRRHVQSVKVRYDKHG